MTTQYILTECDSVTFREHLKTVFKTGLHEVVFEKKDKSIRVMRCTRDPKIISEYLVDSDFDPASPAKKIESIDTLSVYEIDKGWRSFKFETLVGIDGINTDTLFEEANIILI